MNTARTILWICAALALPADAGAQRRLSDLLPRSAGASPPSFYTAGNLYRYMDGAADVFLNYDFRTLLHQEIRTGKVDLTVDVFDMGTPRDAFGIYAAERSPGYDFMTLGVEGYRDEGILNFLQDRYYVKLAAFGEGAGGVLERFARSLSARIGGSRTLPPMLARLPAAGRKPHTEQYLPKDPLGHAFLGPAYQADYARGDRESRLLVSVGKDAADARARLQSLASHFRRGGECGPAPEFGEGALRAGNSYEGTLAARVTGRFLVLLLNPGPGAGEFFRNAAARLEGTW